MVHQNQVKHNKPCQSATMNIHKARTLIEEFQVINFQPLKLAKKEENKWTNRKLQVFSSKKKKKKKKKEKIREKKQIRLLCVLSHQKKVYYVYYYTVPICRLWSF